jgi:hypothetical protein
VPPNLSRTELKRRLAKRRIQERARIVALPLRFTTTGARRGSRRYLTVPVNVGDAGFYDFLLEAGTYAALITPRCDPGCPLLQAALQGTAAPQRCPLLLAAPQGVAPQR